MVGSSRARSGSVAGASGDAGTEYRRGVAAYAVACGLSGVPLPGIEIPPALARVASVSLETDDPVDDIRIDFESGQRALVQAKRSLTAGKPIKEAVAQWVQAARAGLDPARDRLVIVSGTLSGPMRKLQQVLNRERTDHPGSPTKEEAEVLADVQALLGALDEPERALALKCAVIWELRVEEPDEPESQMAIGHLRHVVDNDGDDSAGGAWAALTRIAGRTARLRGGYRLAGWLDALHGEGIEISSTKGTPAAALETRRLALKRYRERLAREGTEMDLRSLGAELPNLPLAQADAGIKVGTNPDDDRDESELIWAFLRRGRAILTGLPGGGKTTALRSLAAHLASDRTLPLPVRVSLREVNMAGSQAGFRDRLVAAAVREDRPADRSVLTTEINERLDKDGGIALILDSLDETYDQRSRVVGEISGLVAAVPEGVCILLATRDVAYGQAATLGWPTLRLRSPSTAESTVTAVLTLAAAQRLPKAADRPGWVAERAAWVRSALAQDSLLCETPLIPVLLALLAVRRSTESLPKQRATILEAVVKDIVADREVRRGNGRALGPLAGTELHTATMHAFTSEAAEILNSQGQAVKESVVAAIAADLREPWGLPPARATTAARDAVHLFDETGIFVLSGAEETVAPRIALFAEIGDAMRIVSRPHEIPDWVDARITGQQFEPLVLACTLDVAVARAVSTALHRNPDDVVLARALVQAAREGAELDDATIRQICECLIGHVAHGTQEGWQSWKDLLGLPVPADLRASAEAAATEFSPEHALVARASLQLRFRPDSSVVEDPQLLKDVLALRALPHWPRSDGDTTLDFRTWLADDSLTRTQAEAAEVLLDQVPHTAHLVTACALEAPDGLQKTLSRLLAERGFDDDVQAIHDATAQKLEELAKSWSWDYDGSFYAHFLRIIADHVMTDLSTTQAILLDELADFVETMDMNTGGSNRLSKQSDETLRELIGLATSLYGFDRAILASQAKITLARMERSQDNDPYFALFDNAQERCAPDWSAVNDPEAAVRLLIRLLTLGLGQARFAAKSLWKAPIAEQAAPRLRALLPKLNPSTRHQRLAAVALASLASGPEPDCWMDSDNPVLRAVAASMITVMGRNSLNDQIRQLLDDPDGHVQEAAIRNIVRAQPPALIEILTSVTSRPTPGWMCLSCRTVNPPPGPTSCSKDDCSIVGANPAKLASEALREAEPRVG
ncbi:NACHT domain-containing protein [Streptomyces sp. NPDC007020]|uniref:NACHT domain-containing protein n=1 Tax=Streptomyces sp. NPDC007020 TaxID=3154585 RepID=UPI003408980F